MAEYPEHGLIGYDDELKLYIDEAVGAGLDEQAVIDTIGESLVGTAGVTVAHTPLDPDISVTIDPEWIEDKIGSSIAAGTGIDVDYDDITGDTTIAVEDGAYIPAGDVTLIEVMTQSAYDVLDPKVATTLYVIQG